MESDYRDSVDAERQRQSREWNDDISPVVWVAVLAEECGEVAQAVLNGDLNHAQQEIIQVAAICERMFHSLTRRSAEGWEPGWPIKARSEALRELIRESEDLGLYE